MDISKKQKIIISIILLLLFCLGLFYFVYSKKNKISNNNDGYVDFVSLNSLTDNSLKEKSDIENKAYMALRAVQMQKNVENCKFLRKKDQNICFFDFASSNNDKKYCEFIDKKEIRDACLETFVYNEAIDSKNIKNCYNIATSSTELCLYEYFRNFNDINDCSVLEEGDKQKCLDSVNGIQAYKTGDGRLCNLVVDNSLKNSCKQAVENKPVDSDNDGISDSMERSYGTNPFNPDTDDDGYSDGDEIRNGHDPLKK